MTDLPKPTRKRIAEGARAQREGKTEAEWRAHVLGVARTQGAILNLLTELEGPEGMAFRVQVREAGGEWSDVPEPETGRDRVH